MSRFLHFGLSCCFVAALGCPQTNIPDDSETLGTVITGVAPLNGGGEMSIFRASVHELLATVTADPSGRFEAKLQASASGDLLIEAKGGTYFEPASATPTNVDGIVLRAAVLAVKPAGKVHVS